MEYSNNTYICHKMITHTHLNYFMCKISIIQTLIVFCMLLQFCKPLHRSALNKTRRTLNYSGDDNLRLMNGDEASLYEYTFMAALVQYDRKKRKEGANIQEQETIHSDNGQLLCGGAIIHKDWIITAARCFNNNSNLQNYEVHAGIVDLTSTVDQQVRQIDEISIHPEYSSTSDEFNIAMIRVTSSFRITTNVRAGYLPTGPLSITNGERCHILGFAVEYETATDEQVDRTYDERLIKVQLHAIDYKDILSRLKFLKTPQPYKLTDKNYGLIQIQDYPHNNSQGACEGDVGGPCICGFKIQGVIAHYTNNTCYNSGYPTTIVDVGYHLNWIRGTILQLNTVPKNLGVQETSIKYILIISYFAMSLLKNLNDYNII